MIYVLHCALYAFYEANKDDYYKEFRINQEFTTCARMVKSK